MADPLVAADMPISDQLAEHADAALSLLRSLSNRTRLLILCRLVEGDMTVGALADAVGLSQPITSQALARLRAEGFVAADRAGRQVTYRIADERVEQVIAALHDAFCPSEEL